MIELLFAKRCGISVKLIMVIKIVIEIKSKVADCFLRANVLERSTANI